MLHEYLVEITLAVIILAVVLILGKFIIIFIQTIGKILIYFKKTGKKMFNQDEGKIECAVGSREMGFWPGKKAENVLI